MLNCDAFEPYERNPNNTRSDLHTSKDQHITYATKAYDFLLWMLDFFQGLYHKYTSWMIYFLRGYCFHTHKIVKIKIPNTMVRIYVEPPRQIILFAYVSFSYLRVRCTNAIYWCACTQLVPRGVNETSKVALIALQGDT
ncbi:hypothetical protein HID58_048164 [Brassica napus]|uniref:Uncharacterized protein n=1 Tax=Brassica napus TaxID=3708 RepID=A0ABQ8B2V0_BRANA|nr:hypothetical protein HID58_048164 [Brassica napus]